jgi:trans-aconitate methyltransferase
VQLPDSTDEQRTHWEAVYRTKAVTETSWYQPVLQRSLELIQAATVPPGAAILDVGGGASTLVDHLLAAGFADVTVLDIASTALAQARVRLGAKAASVQWIAADITTWQPTRRYVVWHDRAVFHFLVDPALRARYLDSLRAALAPGGHVVIATFGPEGPTRCSGLDVQRYSTETLSAVLGSAFRLMRSQLEEHVTPTGKRQQFLYCWWRSEL